MTDVRRREAFSILSRTMYLNRRSYDQGISGDETLELADLQNAIIAALERAPAPGGERAELSLIQRVGRNDDGTLDEVVAHGTVHLEQMDDDQWCLIVSDATETLLLNLWSDSRIHARIEEPVASACPERAATPDVQSGTASLADADIRPPRMESGQAQLMQPSPEPVAWMVQHNNQGFPNQPRVRGVTVPLYAHPPAAAPTPGAGDAPQEEA